MSRCLLTSSGPCRCHVTAIVLLALWISAAVILRQTTCHGGLRTRGHRKYRPLDSPRKKGRKTDASDSSQQPEGIPDFATTTFSLSIECFPSAWTGDRRPEAVLKGTPAQSTGGTVRWSGVCKRSHFRSSSMSITVFDKK